MHAPVCGGARRRDFAHAPLATQKLARDARREQRVCRDNSSPHHHHRPGPLSSCCCSGRSGRPWRRQQLLQQQLLIRQGKPKFNAFANARHIRKCIRENPVTCRNNVAGRVCVHKPRCGRAQLRERGILNRARASRPAQSTELVRRLERWRRWESPLQYPRLVTSQGSIDTLTTVRRIIGGVCRYRRAFGRRLRP